MQLKTECEELSNTVFDLETQRQMEQQALLREKTQLLTELQQIQLDKATLETQYAESNSTWNKEWQVKTQEMEQLHNHLAQLMKEKTVLESRLARSQLERERQHDGFMLEHDRLHAQIEKLSREKAELATALEDLSAMSEQERLDFDVQRVQSQNQVRKLESELHQARKEKNTVQEKENMASRAQVLKWKSDKIDLEQRLQLQSSQIQALETEIKQLMEKLMRIRQAHHHTEGDGNGK